MKFLKTADDYREIGYSNVNQREYAKAHDSFLKASEKYNKIGNFQDEYLCKSLSLLMTIQSDLKNPDRYIRSKASLERVTIPEIKFGLKKIQVSELIDECSLTGEELTLFEKLSKGQYEDVFSIIEEIRTVAHGFQNTIGDRALNIPELFENRYVNGVERSYFLYAISEELLAEHIVWTDPKKSVEHYQMASHWRSLLGQKEDEQTNNQKIHEISQGVICWFCGREIYGKNIHYLPMKTQISEYQLKNEKKELLQSVHPDKQAVFACRVCYYAITNRIDEIAVEYHNKALTEIHRVESELHARISHLQSIMRK
ncbi:hypothetical protein KSK55_02750 [Methanospirillum purgamenti]|jgi:hypothetical protein|uniref:Uncharacterized protein n=1 Tax=Methanospirillum hungatei TaxID=2203 RepID=A0A8F5VPV5_METHU|nr:hypothetical protein [Methanospirillum hungatei]QXO95340.1 hypothetical protein KSK55_02750 [Methanospirillum hungatei]